MLSSIKRLSVSAVSRNYFILFCALALSSLPFTAQAAPAPVPAATLTLPQTGQLIAKGKIFPITWPTWAKPGVTCSSGYIALNRPFPVGQVNPYVWIIAGRLPPKSLAQGIYNWMVPTNLPVADDYILQVVSTCTDGTHLNSVSNFGLRKNGFFLPNVTEGTNELLPVALQLGKSTDVPTNFTFASANLNGPFSINFGHLPAGVNANFPAGSACTTAPVAFSGFTCTSPIDVVFTANQNVKVGNYTVLVNVVVPGQPSDPSSNHVFSFKLKIIPTTKNLVVYVPGMLNEYDSVMGGHYWGYFQDMVAHLTANYMTTGSNRFEAGDGNVWAHPFGPPGYADLVYYQYKSLQQSPLKAGLRLNNALKQIPGLNQYDHIYIITHSGGHPVARSAVLAANGVRCTSDVNDVPPGPLAPDPTMMATLKKTTVISINPLLGGGKVSLIASPIALVGASLKDDVTGSNYENCMFTQGNIDTFNNSLEDYYNYTISGVPDYRNLFNKIPVPNFSELDGFCLGANFFFPGSCPIPPSLMRPDQPIVADFGDEALVDVWNYIGTKDGFSCPEGWPTQHLFSFGKYDINEEWYKMFLRGRAKGTHYISYYYNCKLKGEGNTKMNTGDLLGGLGINSMDAHMMLLDYAPTMRSIERIIYGVHPGR